MSRNAPSSGPWEHMPSGTQKQDAAIALLTFGKWSLVALILAGLLICLDTFFAHQSALTCGAC